MSAIKKLIKEYGESYQNKTNKFVHWFCDPAILFSIIALVLFIQLGTLEFVKINDFKYINWATIPLVLVFIFNNKLPTAKISFGILLLISSSYYGQEMKGTQLISLKKNNYSAICGPVGTVLCNSASYQWLGANMGTNNPTVFPAPFGNYYKTVKEQYLFKASEIIAAGFTGGEITEIAWETIAQNGATNNFNEYQIRIGCTNQNYINSWQSGLSTVFIAQNITIALGLNNFSLNNAYQWDGNSNLLVEICYDNIVTGIYTSNWSTPFEITNFNSAISYRNDLIPACSYLDTNYIVTKKRPVLKIKTCQSLLNLENDRKNEHNLNIYPNPARNKFELVFLLTKKEKIEIKITNALGKIVFLKKTVDYIGQFKETINASNFSKNIYFLQVKISDKLYTKKLVLIN